MNANTKLFLRICGLILMISTTSLAQWTNRAIETNSYPQSEASVAYSPTNSDRILVTWNDFRPTDNGYNTWSKPGYKYSTDNGATWQGGLVTNPTINQVTLQWFQHICRFRPIWECILLPWYEDILVYDR